jgi:chorismate mutase
MPVRGIRGATVAEADTSEAIRAATRELLVALVDANGLAAADVASVIFSVTPDLTAEAPARAARELGWQEAALMCLAEMNATGGLPRCIRVLIHWNTEKRPDQIRHIYLHAAGQLRPDRAVQPNGHAA